MRKISLKNIGPRLKRRYIQTVYKHNPEKLSKLMFKMIMGYPLDLDNPRTFNEKVNWLKLRSDTSLWTFCADKYMVREFIKERGLEDCLVKLYGYWDNVDKIDFDSLPDKFILKSNNGCGTVMAVTDKSALDIEIEKEKLKEWLKMEIGYKYGEHHYIPIKPLIIAEELLENEDKSSLIDYKWFCFDGETKYAQVISNRKLGTHEYSIGVYDTEWNYYANLCAPKLSYSNKTLEKPQQLEKMIEICSILSKGFPEVRVDLYEVNGKVYFGELTFTNAAGYDNEMTREFDELLGNCIKLPK